MTGRDLALDSFWTERPLVRLFIERTGQSTFSLRQLISFAEALPDETINLCVNPNGVRHVGRQFSHHAR